MKKIHRYRTSHHNKAKNKTKIKHKPSGMWVGEWGTWRSSRYGNYTDALQAVIYFHNDYNDTRLGAGVEVHSLVGAVVHDSPTLVHQHLQIILYGSFLRDSDLIYARRS